MSIYKNIFNEFNSTELNSSFVLLAEKYSINLYDVKNIFINTLEEIFGYKVTAINDNEKYSFYLAKDVNSYKKISFSKRIKKTLEEKLIENIESYTKDLRYQRVKKIFKEKEVLKIELLKKYDDSFLCKTHFGLATLPIKNIPSCDIKNYILSSKQYAVIHSYKRSGEVILNAKTMQIDIYKIKSILRNFNVTKVNRFYGVRTKIYIDKIPPKILIDILKKIYVNEKIIFVKEKKSVSKKN